MKKSLGIFTLFFYGATAFLFPEYQKMSYSYEAEIKAKDQDWSDFESGFEVYGTVIVKSWKSGTFIILKDIYHTIISGNIDDEDFKNIKIPEHKLITELPLYIPRENNLSNPIIYVHVNDESISVRWKKSIAMQFILDEKHLDLETEKKYNVKEYMGSLVEEVELYISKDENVTEISKSVNVDMKNVKLGLSSGALEPCKVSLNRNMIVDNTTMPRINEVISLSTYFAENFDSFNPTVYIVQELKLISITNTSIDHSYDLSHYRRYVDTETYKDRNEQNEPTVHEVLNLLESNIEHIENMKIDMNDSISSNKDVFLLHDKLRIINETMFLNIYELFESKSSKSKNMQHMYLEFLSQINTKSSVSAIIYLINIEKIDDETAIRLLRTVSYQFKDVDSQIIEKLNDMIIQNSERSEDFLNVALLCLTSLMKFSSQNEKLKEYYVENLKKTLCKSFSTNQINDQMPLKIAALSNLQIEGTSILDDLNGINSSLITPNFKTITMLNALANQSDLDPKLMAYYQSFVLNSKEAYEVRIMALHILLHRGTTNVLVDTVYKLKDEELCTDYYRILKNINDRSYKRHIPFEDKSEQVIVDKLTISRMKKCANKKLKIQESIHKIRDFFDNLRPQSEMIMYGDLINNKFITFFIKSAKGMTLDHDSIYIRFEFFDDDSFYWIQTDISEIFHRVKYLEIIVMRSETVIYGKSFSNVPLSYALNYLQNYLKDSTSQILDYSINYSKSYMTDIGIPIIVHEKKPIIRMLRTEAQSRQLSFDIRESSRSEFGIKVYNPIMDIWHGCRRQNNLEYRISASIEDLEPYKINIKPIVFDSDFLGYQAYGHSEVYIDTNGKEQEVLQSCIKCNISTVLETSSDEHHRKDYPLWENNDQNKGFVYNSKYFDCDKPYYDNYDNIINEYMDTKQTTNESNRNTFLDVLAYLSTFPRDGTCGIGVRVEKSMNYSTFTLESKMEINESNIASIGIVKIDGNVLHELTSSRIFKNDSLVEKKYSWKNSENFGIFIDTQKTLNNFTFEKHLNIFTGYKNTENAAFYNSSTFEIHIKEKLSDEQKQNFETESSRYKDCLKDPDTSYDECIAFITALRDREVNVKYKNLSKNHIMWMNIFDVYYFRNKNKAYLNTLSNYLDVGKVRLNIQHDFELKHVNISANANNRKLKIDNLSFNDMRWFLQPYSIFRDYEDIPTFFCEVGTNYVQTRLNTKKNSIDLPIKWTKVLSDDISSFYKLDIFTKRAKNDPDSLVLKLMIGNNILNFHKNNKIQMHFNKKMISHDNTKRFHNIADIDYMYLEDYKTVLISLKKTSTVIEYDGHTIKISFISYLSNEGDLCLKSEK